MKILLSLISIFLFCHLNAQNVDSLISSYQYSEAKIALKKQIDSNGKQVKLLNQLAFCLQRLGESSEAMTTYQNSLELDSLQITPRVQLSKLYQSRGQLTAGINVYSKVVLLDSNNTYFIKKYASLLRQAQFPLAAIGFYQKAIRLNPQDEEGKIELIRTLQEANMIEEASDFCDSMLTIHKENERFYYESAKLSYTLKNYQKTVYAIEQACAIKNDTNLIEKKLLAISFFHLKQFEQAIPLFETVVENTDKNEIMYYYLGLCYKHIDRMDLAEANLNKAIDEGTSENLASYYTNLAIVQESNGNYYEAIKAFQKAYKISENSILLYHLARNYDLYYKDKGTAMRYYERFIQANDSTQEVFTNYSKYRLSELKQLMHFKLDSLN